MTGFEKGFSEELSKIAGPRFRLASKALKSPKIKAPKVKEITKKVLTSPLSRAKKIEPKTKQHFYAGV
jgi:hypothetical protein